nr:hypothetical protein Iba_chr14bCG9370 [Ipomoea batatas]GMD89839.1 hypothetical protein Iba_chr14dCG3910 [Ipomoea batatas]
MTKSNLSKRDLGCCIWTRKTFSGANRFIELPVDIVSLPDATTNIGPSLKNVSRATLAIC